MSAQPSNAFILIDPFDTGATPAFFPPPGPTNYTDTGTGSVGGGQREVRITPPPAGGLAGVPASGSGSSFNIQNFATNGPDTAITRLRWDGNTNTPAAGPDTSGTNGFSPPNVLPENLIRVNVIKTNDLLAGSMLSFSLYDVAGRVAISSLVLPVGSVLTPADYDFTFASFLTNNPLLDLTQITAVELQVTLIGGNTNPFSIQFNQTQFGVPFEFSPALGVVSLAALFGLSYLRNRRKSSASPNLETSKSEIDSLVS